MACKECNDIPGEGAALGELLTLAPKDLAALLANAALLERIRHIDAPKAYAKALQAAPPRRKTGRKISRPTRTRQGVSDRTPPRLIYALCPGKVSEIGSRNDRHAARALARRRGDLGRNHVPMHHCRATQACWCHGSPQLRSTIDRLFPWLDEFEAETDVMREELGHALKSEERRVRAVRGAR